MKNILISLGILVIISTLFFYLFTETPKEKYFNRVELSDNNIITNNEMKPFYDTILSVGLQESNIKGISVVISELSEGAKAQFPSGELRAHIRFYNGIFYLFIDDFERREAIEVISHEVIHIEQYLTQSLVYNEQGLWWKDKEYDLDNLEYDDRPWERDAFTRGGFLGQRVEKILID